VGKSGVGEGKIKEGRRKMKEKGRRG